MTLVLANGPPRSAMTPNKPGRGCGQAATSSRGYIEYVSGRAEFRPIARTTPMLILENGGDRPAQSLFEHRGSCRRTLPADPCLLSPTSALERITDSSQTSCQVRNVPTRDSCTAAMAAFIRSPRARAMIVVDTSRATEAQGKATSHTARSSRVSISSLSKMKSMGLVNKPSAPLSIALRLVSGSP